MWYYPSIQDRFQVEPKNLTSLFFSLQALYLSLEEDTVKGTVGTVDTSIPAPELLQEIDTMPARKRREK